MSQRLERVRQAARQRTKERFTALLHHLDIDLLLTAYFWLERNAAAGIDGVTWAHYEGALEDNLKDLHRRIHGNAYQAQPSRRQYIPKADGKLRPSGSCPGGGGQCGLVLASPRDRDRDRPSPGIDAVLDELGNRSEWIALREGDDSDSVPVMADL